LIIIPPPLSEMPIIRRNSEEILIINTTTEALYFDMELTHLIDDADTLRHDKIYTTERKNFLLSLNHKATIRIINALSVWRYVNSMIENKTQLESLLTQLEENSPDLPAEYLKERDSLIGRIQTVLPLADEALAQWSELA
jgi:hypothetical protein